MTRIAKIVKSKFARRLHRARDRPPRRGRAAGAEDYGFAQFVSLPVADNFEVVGVVYDTQLVNPEYGQFGPRLSPAADLAVLSPDYLNEQGVLVGILLLGWRAGVRAHGRAAPRDSGRAGRVSPGRDAGRRVSSRRRGARRVAYYSQIVAHAGAFAVPLVEAILEQLETVCTPEERQRFCVLKRSLAWQRTLGGVRL
jgi:hypothetical protein